MCRAAAIIEWSGEIGTKTADSRIDTFEFGSRTKGECDRSLSTVSVSTRRESAPDPRQSFRLIPDHEHKHTNSDRRDSRCACASRWCPDFLVREKNKMKIKNEFVVRGEKEESRRERRRRNLQDNKNLLVN